MAPASPPPRESKAERSIAEMCLGAGHPLVRLLGRSEVASEQLVSVTAVQAAGVVFLCAGRVSGSSLAIAAAVVPVALSCRVAALKSLRHNLCLELIVEGGASLPLPCIERVGQRLVDRRTLEQLVRSVEEWCKLRQELRRARYLLTARATSECSRRG